MTHLATQRTRDFHAQLRGKENVYGVFVGSPTPFALDTIDSAGWDFVIIEGQHAPNSTADLAAALISLSHTGLPALVRVDGHEPYSIAKVFDAGAAGVIVPMVETVEQAEAIVAATRFRPRGVRSFGPIRSDLVGLRPAELEERVFVFVMIETALGLENAEAIAAVDGVDGIFAGMADLAISRGQDPLHAYTSDAMKGDFAELRRISDDAGIVLGAPAFGPENAERWREYGCQLVTVSFESAIVGRATREALEVLRPGSTPPRDESSPYS
ncbi:aldolase/citrate lyase family protein [Salinibacterium sp. ZJ77]|uniref:HpcH/HpaI aldolase family protein n=1 Tax=Salinibacterium sp. ZJ77 TaxID=2708337 RepID=UPI00141E603E|nr:aldolase/citrate lyase family protein [Salinibacterium sp. ZJ77]